MVTHDLGNGLNGINMLDRADNRHPGYPDLDLVDRRKRQIGIDIIVRRIKMFDIKKKLGVLARSQATHKTGHLALKILERGPSDLSQVQ